MHIHKWLYDTAQVHIPQSAGSDSFINMWESGYNLNM